MRLACKTRHFRWYWVCKLDNPWEQSSPKTVSAWNISFGTRSPPHTNRILFLGYSEYGEITKDTRALWNAERPRSYVCISPDNAGKHGVGETWVVPQRWSQITSPTQELHFCHQFLIRRELQKWQWTGAYCGGAPLHLTGIACQPHDRNSGGLERTLYSIRILRYLFFDTELVRRNLIQLLLGKPKRSDWLSGSLTIAVAHRTTTIERYAHSCLLHSFPGFFFPCLFACCTTIPINKQEVILEFWQLYMSTVFLSFLVVFQPNSSKQHNQVLQGNKDRLLLSSTSKDSGMRQKGKTTNVGIYCLCLFTEYRTACNVHCQQRSPLV